MLILTRKTNESIIINGNIEVKILSSRGQVRIGIDAPKEVTVHREEIQNKITTKEMK